MLFFPKSEKRRIWLPEGSSGCTLVRGQRMDRRARLLPERKLRKPELLLLRKCFLQPLLRKQQFMRKRLLRQSLPPSEALQALSSLYSAAI